MLLSAAPRGDQLNQSTHDTAAPWSRRLPWLAALTALAFGGNFLKLSIGFNVDFIFGSVAGLMAVVLLGPTLGVGASLVGAVATFVLWNHPYALVIFGCEALWVALVLRRRPGWPIFLVDLAYWVALGTPLVFAFYFGVMNLGLRGAAIIALKQSLNGVFNAVLAGMLLHFLPLRRWMGLKARPPPRTAQLFFEFMAFLLLVSSIAGLTYVNHRVIESSQRSLAIRVQQAGTEVNWLVSRWLEQHRRAVELLAARGAEAGFRRSGQLQVDIEEVHRVFPDFHNVFVADGSATTLAFDPPVNERGESTVGLRFADREWFRLLKEAGQTRVSDVFPGRGGVFEPIITISTPVLQDGRLVGLGLGAVNLGRLEALTHEIARSSHLSVTLLDRKGLVISSTDTERAPLSTWRPPASDEEEAIVPGVHMNIPAARKNISAMQTWQEAAYFTRSPVEMAGWTVVIEGRLAPLQQSVYESTIRNIAWIYTLLLAVGVAALWLGRHLSRQLVELAAISAGIPEKIDSGGPIDWPSPESMEVAALTTNFRATAEALRGKVLDLEAHGQRLEKAVAERTAALVQREAEAIQVAALLAESERRYRALFENLREDVTVFGVVRDERGAAIDWTLRESNAEARRYFGDRYQAAVGRRMTELVGEAEFRPFIDRTEAILAGDVRVHELHSQANDRYYRSATFAIDADTLVSAAIDITDRKRVELALQEREARLRAYFESPSVGVVITDASGEFLEVNDTFCAMLGRAREEVVRVGWRGLTHPEDLAAGERGLAQVVAGERARYSADKRYLKKDGSVLWAFISLSRATPPGGGHPQVVAIITDIGQRKAAEEGLRETEQRLKAALDEQAVVLENATVGITLVRHRRQIWASAHMVRLFGYSPAEMDGVETRVFYPSVEAWEEVGARAYSALRAGQTYAGEHPMRRKDGSIFWARLQGRLIDAAHEETGSIWCIEDVTDLKALGARASQAERIAATATLANGMAHEVNNPLASVIGNLGFVQEQLELEGQVQPGQSGSDLTKVLPEVLQAVKDAAESAARIKNIVADLRSFALGDLPTGPSSDSLVEAVRDARRIAAQDLSTCRAISVEVPQGCSIPVPRTDLVQLIAHLLINAGQATGSRPNDVRVEAEVSDQGHVLLRVKDSGIGMREAVRTRAFEPFFTTKDVGKGRGLGLSVCLGIVQAAGGEITLDSQPEEGTTVTVRIPPRGTSKTPLRG